MILERIRPDVIFAEIPESLYPRFLDDALGTIEPKAISLYSRGHEIPIVPVDSGTDDSVDYGHSTVIRRVALARPQFRELVDRRAVSVTEKGFLYLNSDQCVEDSRAIHVEIRASIDWLRSAELGPMHDKWMQMHDQRERGFLETVETFASTSELAVGVLLVGSEHRRPIIQKLRDQERSQGSSIEWVTDLPDELLANLTADPD